MTPKTKKILIGVGVAFAIGAIYAKNKVDRLIAIWNKMDIIPNEIRNVDVNLQRIRFNIDIRLQNNTPDNFYISGGWFADLKQMSFFYDGQFIATADVIINKIEVPGSGSTILKNIEVNAPTVGAIRNLSTLSNFNMSKITCSAVIKAFGKEHTLIQ